MYHQLEKMIKEIDLFFKRNSAEILELRSTITEAKAHWRDSTIDRSWQKINRDGPGEELSGKNTNGRKDL